MKLTSMGKPAKRPNLEFHRLVWVLPCAWILHEAEEWNILAWYERYWVNIPPMNPSVVRLGLVLVGSVGLVWTFIGTLPGKPRIAAFFVLPFFTIIAFGNAMQHIYFAYKFEAYAPGMITAVILVIPITLYLTYLAVKRGLIPWWYAAAICLPVVPAMMTAMRTGNEFPAVMRAIYSAAEYVARRLFDGA